jgi:hypothetical protein
MFHGGSACQLEECAQYMEILKILLSADMMETGSVVYVHCFSKQKKVIIGTLTD